MRAVANDAWSVRPTLELVFGTKVQLLHVVSDVAFARSAIKK
jgi:hypothetical protein